MALPVVKIDNSAGSNVTASGAGAVNASGTLAAAVSGSASVNITDLMDLSAVDSLGSATLYVATSAGRKHSKITGVSGTSGNWTITTEDTWGATGTFSWATGGSRLDLETTNTHTRDVFADGKGGWIVEFVATATDYTVTATTTVSVVATTLTGVLEVRGAIAGARPVIKSATNSVALFTLNGSNFLKVRHLYLKHTATTRGNGFTCSTTAPTHVELSDLVIDGCAWGLDGGTRDINYLSVHDVDVINCTVGGVRNGTTMTSGGGTFVTNSYFYNIAGNALDTNGNTADYFVAFCILAKNTKGFNDGGTSRTQRFTFIRNVIANNTGDGISIAETTGSVQLILDSNIIYGNGNAGTVYGVNVADTLLETDTRVLVNQRNFYGNNRTADRNGLSAGLNDVALTADPFVDSANQNWGLNSAAGGGALVRTAGSPGAYRTGATVAYADGGAVQHQDSGGAAVVTMI